MEIILGFGGVIFAVILVITCILIAVARYSKKQAHHDRVCDQNTMPWHIINTTQHDGGVNYSESSCDSTNTSDSSSCDSGSSSD